MKHNDKLAKRVRRLEDRHRRDMTNLRSELLGIVALLAPIDDRYAATDDWIEGGTDHAWLAAAQEKLNA